MDFELFDLINFSTPFTTALAIYGIIAYIVAVIAEWRILVKAGEKGWKSLIPFYNLYVSHEIAGMKHVWFFFEIALWMIELVFETLEEMVEFPEEIPLVFGIIIGTITLVMEIYHSILLCKRFGKGRGFTVGVILLPAVFLPILAFDRSVYTKPEHAH